MREIRFRAWSKTDKKMFDRVLAGPGNPCSIVWREDRKEWAQFDEFCGELMQYTGFKDTKGQETYEGDIVKGSLSKRGIVGPFIGRIYWCESQFQWWVTDDTKDPVIGINYDLVFLEAYQDLEVIGNIYEHRHLIEGESENEQ